MQITSRSNIRALALLGLLFPAPTAAQVSEACNPEDITNDKVLMYCTFNGGAKQVAVCQSHDIVYYQFGKDLRDAELTLSNNVLDLDYVPYRWGSNTVYESVTFYNGNTSYKIFSSASALYDALPADGGITVTLPDQTPIALTCDAGSVIPNSPLEGIGKLTSFAPADGYYLLQNCVDNTDDPQSCIGRVRVPELEQNRCVLGSDQTDCWATEAAAWNALLNSRITTALAQVTRIRGDAFAERLGAAQTTWITTRIFDCDLILTLPFAGDGGAAACNVEYAAKRLQFLRDVVSMAEFDG